jgi:hypothetical protein
MKESPNPVEPGGRTIKAYPKTDYRAIASVVYASSKKTSRIRISRGFRTSLYVPQREALHGRLQVLWRN